MINPTGQNLSWKRGQVIGEAFEAVAIEPDLDIPTEDSKQVRGVGLSSSTPIPAHLQGLWEQSIKHLRNRKF